MRPFLILLLGTTLTFACSSDPKPPAGGTADPLKDELEHRLDAAAAAGFSGSALVTVDGRTVLAKGYGLADRANHVPNGVDTAFDVGSILKDLTAAAIFKLAGEGKLAMTDTLATHFDGVPADKAAITVLQVVLHRAGFDEYHDTKGDFEPMTRLEARQRIFAQPLLFEPGTDAAYSNSGYTLLADIVETVSGRTYTDYVREQLLAPAHMQQSGFYGDPVWQHVDTAIGYDASVFETNDPAGWPYTWALVGNGGLVATVSDLEHWVTNVWHGGVLPPAALEAYRSQYLSTGGQVFEGKMVYAFAGAGDFGLGGFVLDCPEANTRVILGTNANTKFDIEAFGEELGKFVLSRK